MSLIIRANRGLSVTWKSLPADVTIKLSSSRTIEVDSNGLKYTSAVLGGPGLAHAEMQIATATADAAFLTGRPHLFCV